MTGCQSPPPPPPATYSCGTPEAGHCYSQAYLNQGGINHGVGVTIEASLGINPGDGFISNEVWYLNMNGFFGWIESGELTEAVSHSYFMATLSTNGVFMKTYFGGVPAADDGGYFRVDIHGVGPGIYSVSITSPTRHYSATVKNDTFTDPDADPEPVIGQELEGASNAQAPVVPFLFSSGYDGAGRTHYYSTDGFVNVQKPPYGGWIALPSSSYGRGGAFVTYCCTP